MEGSIEGVSAGVPFTGRITISGPVAGEVDIPQAPPPPDGQKIIFVEGFGIGIEEATDLAGNHVVKIVNEKPYLGQDGGGGSVDENWLNLADFGAVEGEDIAPAFEAAIRVGMDRGIHNISVPHGTFPLSRQINFPGNFRAWKIRGAGIADGGVWGERFTRLLYNPNTGCALNLVAVRLAEVSDIVIEGVNTAAQTLVETNRSSVKAWDAKNWVSNPAMLDRDNALAGIGIDYQQTQAPWAAQIIISNVKVTHMAVAFNVSGSRGSQQGDTVIFRRCKVENCAYAYAINQDQCRAVAIYDPWINNCYCAFSNMVFGDGNGSAFNIFGGQITTCFRVFECTNAYAGTMAVVGIFCEACGIIGSINGLGDNANGVAFIECEFGLDDDGYAEEGGNLSYTTPMAVFSAGGNIVFTAGKMRSKKQYVAFGGGYYIFDGFQFTETRPIFPFEYEVEIRGRNKFRTGENNERSFLADMVTTSTQEKYYVRRAITHVRKPSGQRVINATPACEIPAVYGATWAAAPNNEGSRVFSLPISANEAERFVVGDLLLAKCKGNIISNMDTRFGDVRVPCLRVLEVTTSAVKLEKITPEVNVPAGDMLGDVWAERQIWIAGKPISAQTEGKTAEIEGADALRVGDFALGLSGVVRVARINGKSVTFTGEVEAGEIKCFS